MFSVKKQVRIENVSREGVANVLEIDSELAMSFYGQYQVPYLPAVKLADHEKKDYAHCVHCYIVYIVYMCIV